MKLTRHVQALLVGAALLGVRHAGASAEECPLHRELPVERQLRRLSIDLRGVVPSYEEYAAVEGKASIPDSIVDAYVASDEFRQQMRRHHEAMLWTNPIVSLGDFIFSLTSTKFPDSTVVYRMGPQSASKLYRGGDGTHGCQNKDQATLGYDPSGLPNTEPVGTDAVGPYVAEGWIEVHPYWETDPVKTIKVCAFDAQANQNYTLPDGDPNAGVHSCDDTFAIGKAKSCGCGPNLDYCINTAVDLSVKASLREQVMRLVDDLSDGSHPYSELLTTKRSWVNGPIAHYFRYLAPRKQITSTVNAHVAADGPIPELGYMDASTWVEVERQAPHAGVLTLPAFLLRFQTYRGRANRYRIAFEGQYFQPPSPKDTGCEKDTDDLTRHCVCRNCHMTLEPMAAYFGQFTEAGSLALTDMDPSYASRAACLKSAPFQSSAWCDRFYSLVPDAVDPDITSFRLKPLRYADVDHPLIQPHHDGGPLALAEDDIQSGLFHEVATRQMFAFLMKREADLDTTSPTYEGNEIAAIAAEFKAHDSLPLMVASLVKLPTYRRMP